MFQIIVYHFLIKMEGERPGFSLKLADWLRKAMAVFGSLSRPCTVAPDSQLVLWLCLNYKSPSRNGHGWHLDIFKKSKRPDLNGNQFHFTNLGLHTPSLFLCLPETYLWVSWSSEDYFSHTVAPISYKTTLLFPSSISKWKNWFLKFYIRKKNHQSAKVYLNHDILIV